MRFFAMVCLLAACGPAAPAESYDRARPTGVDDDTGDDTDDDEPPARRLSIRFDYRFDDAGFFDAAARRQALEAASALWSQHFVDDFEAVPVGTRVRLKDPEDRETYVWVELEEPIDDLLVFVGTTEDMLGVGRSGPSTWAEGEDSAVLAALDARRDGSDFQPWAGSMSFKGSADWYFDPTPETDADIPDDAADFILYAAHELGHVLGFASCDAFTALVEGESFVGEAAQEAHGGDVPLTADAGHLDNGLESEGDEALMDPGGTSGMRKRPTPLDVAVLVDLGFEPAP